MGEPLVLARGNPWFPREPPPCGRLRGWWVSGAARSSAGSEVSRRSEPPAGRSPAPAATQARGDPWVPPVAPPCGGLLGSCLSGAAFCSRGSRFPFVVSLPPGESRLRRRLVVLSE